MHIEDIRDFVLTLDEVEETTPFGNDVLVYKTNNKIFLLLPLDTNPVQFNVKCNPDYAVLLREQYPDTVLPGYHMNKKHWNTIVVDGRLTARQLQQMILDSKNLVGKKKK